MLQKAFLSLLLIALLSFVSADPAACALRSSVFKYSGQGVHSVLFKSEVPLSNVSLIATVNNGQEQPLALSVRPDKHSAVLQMYLDVNSTLRYHFSYVTADGQACSTESEKYVVSTYADMDTQSVDTDESFEAAQVTVGPSVTGCPALTFRQEVVEVSPNTFLIRFINTHPTRFPAWIDIHWSAASVSGDFTHATFGQQNVRMIASADKQVHEVTATIPGFRSRDIHLKYFFTYCAAPDVIDCDTEMFEYQQQAEAMRRLLEQKRHYAQPRAMPVEEGQAPVEQQQQPVSEQAHAEQKQRYAQPRAMPVEEQQPGQVMPQAPPPAPSISKHEMLRRYGMMPPMEQPIAQPTVQPSGKKHHQQNGMQPVQSNMNERMPVSVEPIN